MARSRSPALDADGKPVIATSRQHLDAHGKPRPTAKVQSRPPPGECLDPDDQWRDHLDGQAAEWDVPNDDPNREKLFVIGNKSSLAAFDHGLDILQWAAFLKLLHSEQFDESAYPLPKPSTAITQEQRIDEMILRHHAHEALWNKREDACQRLHLLPDIPTQMLEVATKQKHKRGLLIVIDPLDEEDEIAEVEMERLFVDEFVNKRHRLQKRINRLRRLKGEEEALKCLQY